MEDVVGCSPLGLYCRLCRTPFDGVQDQKCLRTHIQKFHPALSGQPQNYKAAVKSARTSSQHLTVEDSLIGLPKKGMECSVCGFVFRRRVQANFKNHLGTKIGRACAEQNAMAVQVKYRHTQCGRRYVVERPATVPLLDDDAPVQVQEEIVEQRGQKRKEPSSWFENLAEDCCRPLLNREDWCTQLDLPDHEAAALMRPYCREDESEEYYAIHFAPIMGGCAVNFEVKLRQLISLWSPAVDPATEPDLVHFLTVGFEWFENYAYGQVARLPANIRDGLLVLSLHSGSFIMRDELSKLVAFAWRYPSIALDSFKVRFRQMQKQGTTMERMVSSAIFHRFLTTLHMETPAPAPTMIVQFCLSRCFKAPRSANEKLQMVECQMAGSRFSDVLHLARAGVLGTILFHPTVTQPGDAWFDVAEAAVRKARQCYFTYTISEMIADCRAMKAKNHRNTPIETRDRFERAAHYE